MVAFSFYYKQCYCCIPHPLSRTTLMEWVNLGNSLKDEFPPEWKDTTVISSCASRVWRFFKALPTNEDFDENRKLLQSTIL